MRTTCPPLLLSCALVWASAAPVARPQRSPPRVRTPTPPIQRGLPPEVRAPRYGWGWGPNVRSPEEGTRTRGVLHTPVKPKTPPREQRARIRLLIRRLEKTTPLRAVHVVWGLGSPLGCFGDLDGDGKAELVTLEVAGDRTRLAVFFERGGTWRSLAAVLGVLRGARPLAPQILSDDGTGKAAILLPSARPPFLYVVPTDGRGGIDLGHGRSLEKYLPDGAGKRKDGEVPYVIRKVTSGAAGAPARIEGLFQERNAAGEVLQRRWTIVLLGPRASSTFGRPATADRFVAADTAVGREVVWSDFDADGRTDVLAARTRSSGRRAVATLTYGAGRAGATEPRPVDRLSATLPAGRRPDSLLLLRRVEAPGRRVYCLWFRPYGVGVFLR